jgi:hypothetical protein
MRVTCPACGFRHWMFDGACPACKLPWTLAWGFGATRRGGTVPGAGSRAAIAAAVAAGVLRCVLLLGAVVAGAIVVAVVSVLGQACRGGARGVGAGRGLGLGGGPSVGFPYESGLQPPWPSSGGGFAQAAGRRLLGRWR